MRTLRILTIGVGLILVSATLASAQATRTWVSGVGDDANPCSRTAPCKTFAGAITKTAASGEINVLDPGGFGSVTITKSIAIVNEGSLGGVLASLVNGFIINTPGVHVVLRGLDINGAGNGADGIRFLQGASLTVEDCRIYGFAGNGIEATHGAGSTMFVRDSTISGNASGGIMTTGAGDAVLDNVRLYRNGVAGLSVSAGEVMVRNSVASGNTGHGIEARLTAVVNIDNSGISGNELDGIRTGGTAILRIGNSTIVGNMSGLQAKGSSAIVSLGNNAVAGNGIDGAPTSTIPRL
jgi:Right handed beta helix region